MNYPYPCGDHWKVSGDGYSETVSAPASKHRIQLSVNVEEDATSLSEVQAREFGLCLEPSLLVDMAEDLVQVLVSTHHIVVRGPVPPWAIMVSVLGNCLKYVIIDASGGPRYAVAPVCNCSAESRVLEEWSSVEIPIPANNSAEIVPLEFCCHRSTHSRINPDPFIQSGSARSKRNVIGDIFAYDPTEEATASTSGPDHSIR